MRTDEWLRDAADKLKRAEIGSYRLDAELILADILGRERVYVHAHGEAQLTEPQLQRASQLLKRRLGRTPLAYIFGHKEFYGRDFVVTPNVLIPRPETEALIELTESLELPPHATVADIGTGSGAIAITLKLNQPEWRVLATDIDTGALAIAAENAKRLGADIIFLQGDLAKPLRGLVDVIVANLPYVDRGWNRSPETDFEPQIALFADNHGMALIEKLIAEAPDHLTDDGCLLLEADPEQHAAIVTVAKEKSLRHIRTEGYAVLLQR